MTVNLSLTLNEVNSILVCLGECKERWIRKGEHTTVNHLLNIKNKILTQAELQNYLTDNFCLYEDNKENRANLVKWEQEQDYSEFKESRER